ncbi:MAG: PG0541 family transporter-associated protein [Lentisphaerota bacterium]
MKMITIAYDEGIDEAVMEVLRSHIQIEFTKWKKVAGWGQHSEPHLMSDIWPKANNVLMTCAEDEKAAQIMDALRQVKQSVQHLGLKAFAWPIEDLT